MSSAEAIFTVAQISRPPAGIGLVGTRTWANRARATPRRPAPSRRLAGPTAFVIWSWDLARPTAAPYNLDGGLLSLVNVQGSAAAIYAGAGSAAFNFSGGTLQFNLGTPVAGPEFSCSMSMTFGTSGGGATFDTAGNMMTLSGSLSGIGGLTKIGSGTLLLAATNTYSGNTLISGGTLALGSPLALQDSTLDTSGSGSLSFGALTSPR